MSCEDEDGCQWTAGVGGETDAGGGVEMPAIEMPAIKATLFYDSLDERVALITTDGGDLQLEDYPSKKVYTTGGEDGPTCADLTSPFRAFMLTSEHSCLGTDAVTVNGAEVSNAVKYQWTVDMSDLAGSFDGLDISMTQTLHVKQASDSGCTAAGNGCLTNCAKAVELVRYEDTTEMMGITTKMTMGVWNQVRGISSTDYQRYFTPPAAAVAVCDKCKTDTDCRDTSSSRCNTEANPNVCAGCTADTSCAQFSPVFTMCTAGSCVEPPPPPPPPPEPAHECTDNAGCTTAAKARCAIPADGKCYDSPMPPSCSGYENHGYTIRGGWAAGQPVTGDPDICARHVPNGVVAITAEGQARCVVHEDDNNLVINTCQACQTDEDCEDIAGGKTDCFEGECIVPKCPGTAPAGCQCAAGLTYCTNVNGMPVDDKFNDLAYTDEFIKEAVETISLLPTFPSSCATELKEFMCECYFWECKANWKKEAEDCAKNFVCSTLPMSGGSSASLIGGPQAAEQSTAPVASSGTRLALLATATLIIVAELQGAQGNQ